MKFSLKMTLFTISTSAVGFGIGPCFARWLGDLTGDYLWMRGLYLLSV
jgi:hypothetical protein